MGAQGHPTTEPTGSMECCDIWSWAAFSAYVCYERT